MAKAKVTYDDRRLRSNLERYEDHVDEMLGVIMDYHAARGLARMKTEAPWTDRTGAARSGLFSVVEHPKKGSYTIIFSYSVHYGFWLEVKFSGRDAIIRPTIVSQGHELMQDIRRKFS